MNMLWRFKHLSSALLISLFSTIRDLGTSLVTILFPKLFYFNAINFFPAIKIRLYNLLERFYTTQSVRFQILSFSKYSISGQYCARGNLLLFIFGPFSSYVTFLKSSFIVNSTGLYLRVSTAYKLFYLFWMG